MRECFWLIATTEERTMRQKPGTKQSHGEKVAKDIRRATRKQYSAEEKIRIVLDGPKGEDSIGYIACVGNSEFSPCGSGSRAGLQNPLGNVLGDHLIRCRFPIQKTALARISVFTSVAKQRMQVLVFQ
jgi:hypothetical protein